MIPNLIPLWAIPWNYQCYFNQQLYLHSLYRSTLLVTKSTTDLTTKLQSPYFQLLLYRYLVLCQVLLKIILSGVIASLGAEFCVFGLLSMTLTALTGVIVWQFTNSLFRQTLHNFMVSGNRPV